MVLCTGLLAVYHLSFEMDVFYFPGAGRGDASRD